MTAAYRMTNEGWTADRAFAEMKQYKFGADFLHPEFKAYVLGFKPESSITVSPPAVPVDLPAAVASATISPAAR
jgi:hypothetical protein